jgi:hypothetical protein
MSAKQNKPAPPDDGKKTTTISLRRETHEAVKEMAERERRSVSGQIEVIIETALEETP